jgi:hypothetical protein
VPLVRSKPRHSLVLCCREPYELTSKHNSSIPWGQSTALWPFVRYDTKKKSGAHSQWGKGKEEWAPVIWLYSIRTYVPVNPGPNKTRFLQTPPPDPPHEDHEQYK